MFDVHFQFETIAAGVIVGLGGRKQNNTSPKLDKSKVIAPTAPSPSKDPGAETETIKSMFQLLLSFF